MREDLDSINVWAQTIPGAIIHDSECGQAEISGRNPPGVSLPPLSPPISSMHPRSAMGLRQRVSDFVSDHPVAVGAAAVVAVSGAVWLYRSLPSPPSSESAAVSRSDDNVHDFDPDALLANALNSSDDDERHSGDASPADSGSSVQGFVGDELKPCSVPSVGVSLSIPSQWSMIDQRAETHVVVTSFSSRPPSVDPSAEAAPSPTLTIVAEDSRLSRPSAAEYAAQSKKALARMLGSSLNVLRDEPLKIGPFEYCFEYICGGSAADVGGTDASSGSAIRSFNLIAVVEVVAYTFQYTSPVSQFEAALPSMLAAAGSTILQPPPASRGALLVRSTPAEDDEDLYHTHTGAPSSHPQLCAVLLDVSRVLDPEPSLLGTSAVSVAVPLPTPTPSTTAAAKRDADEDADDADEPPPPPLAVVTHVTQIPLDALSFSSAIASEHPVVAVMEAVEAAVVRCMPDDDAAEGGNGVEVCLLGRPLGSREGGADAAADVEGFGAVAPPLATSVPTGAAHARRGVAIATKVSDWVVHSASESAAIARASVTVAASSLPLTLSHPASAVDVMAPPSTAPPPSSVPPSAAPGSAFADARDATAPPSSPHAGARRGGDPATPHVESQAEESFGSLPPLMLASPVPVGSSPGLGRSTPPPTDTPLGAALAGDGISGSSATMGGVKSPAGGSRSVVVGRSARSSRHLLAASLWSSAVLHDAPFVVVQVSTPEYRDAGLAMVVVAVMPMWQTSVTADASVGPSGLVELHPVDGGEERAAKGSSLVGGELVCLAAVVPEVDVTTAAALLTRLYGGLVVLGVGDDTVGRAVGNAIYSHREGGRDRDSAASALAGFHVRVGVHVAIPIVPRSSILVKLFERGVRVEGNVGRSDPLHSKKKGRGASAGVYVTVHARAEGPLLHVLTLPVSEGVANTLSDAKTAVAAVMEVEDVAFGVQNIEAFSSMSTINTPTPSGSVPHCAYAVLAIHDGSFIEAKWVSRQVQWTKYKPTADVISGSFAVW